jgi:hypothetical protein
MKSDFAAGASGSLNKTTTAIMRFLEHEEDRSARRLRDYLLDRLGDLAVKWYRRGFSRGHKESHQRAADGKVSGRTSL